MTDKMTIEKARKILKHASDRNHECSCHLCRRCADFIEGHESRDAEIAKVLKVLRAVEDDHYYNRAILKMTTVKNVQDLIIELLEESK